MLKQFRKSDSGLTLIELLVTVFILSVGIVSVLVFITSAMLLSAGAWDTTVAVSHAEYILEEMQTRNFLASVTLTDWDQWAQKEGLKTLPSESVWVTFPSGGSLPLDILVTVYWTKHSRLENVTLRTKMIR